MGALKPTDARKPSDCNPWAFMKSGDESLIPQ